MKSLLVLVALSFGLSAQAASKSVIEYWAQAANTIENTNNGFRFSALADKAVTQKILKSSLNGSKQKAMQGTMTSKRVFDRLNQDAHGAWESYSRDYALAKDVDAFFATNKKWYYIWEAATYEACSGGLEYFISQDGRYEFVIDSTNCY